MVFGNHYIFSQRKVSSYEDHDYKRGNNYLDDNEVVESIRAGFLDSMLAANNKTDPAPADIPPATRKDRYF